MFSSEARLTAEWGFVKDYLESQEVAPDSGEIASFFDIEDSQAKADLKELEKRGLLVKHRGLYYPAERGEV